MFYPEQMTEAYYWKVIGRLSPPEGHLKLLDTDELYDEKPAEMHLLKKWDFNKAYKDCLWEEGKPENGAYCLFKEQQRTPEWEVLIENKDFDWLRAAVVIKLQRKEWTFWRMTQLIVTFKKGEEQVKQRFLRLQRFLNDGEQARIFLDVRQPDEDFDRVSVQCWHADSDTFIRLDNLTLSVFEEE